MPESKATPAEPHNYRLAVHPDTGAHGYEVGFWPSGADLNDPGQFIVTARCYSQAEAQALAANADANPPDHLPPEEGSQAQSKRLTRSELDDMTKESLLAYAAEHHITVSSHDNKADIVDTIARHRK